MDIQRRGRQAATGSEMFETKAPASSAEGVVMVHPAPRPSEPGHPSETKAGPLPAPPPGRDTLAAPPTGGGTSGFRRLLDRAVTWLRNTFVWSWHQTSSSPQARAQARVALSEDERAEFRAANLEALRQDFTLAAYERSQRTGDRRAWNFLNTGEPNPRRESRDTTFQLELFEALAAHTAGMDALESGNLSTRQGRKATRATLDILESMGRLPGVTATGVVAILKRADPSEPDRLKAVQVAALMTIDPNLSPQRAGLLLDFAAASAGHPLEVAMALCQPTMTRTGFDARGVAEGSALDAALIPPDFQPFHRSYFNNDGNAPVLAQAPADHPHQQLVMNFGREREIRNVQLEDGHFLPLNKGLIKDSNRATYLVNNQLMPRDWPAFVEAFRAGFPPGPRGDHVATLVSDCANQFSVHPLYTLVGNQTIVPLAKTDSIMYETWENPDGNWSVRATLLSKFTMGMKASGPGAGEPIDMAEGSAALHTVTFNIRPGTAEDTRARLESVESEVVFTGRRATPAPQAS